MWKKNTRLFAHNETLAGFFLLPRVLLFVLTLIFNSGAFLAAASFFILSKKSFQIINQTRQINEFSFFGGHFTDS